MYNIMLVIEVTVMPMLMDAVVRVEANRSSVIEDMFSQVDEQKKKLQYCFRSKLYPDAVRMSPNVPAIKYGGGSISWGVVTGDCHGNSSRGLTADDGFAMGVDDVRSHDGVAKSFAVEASVSCTITDAGDVFGSEHVAVGGGDVSAGTSTAVEHDGIHSLVPHGESEEEVPLPDDDVAFCPRSMFSEAGGLGASPASSSGNVAATRECTDEAYARELDSKLEKEIDTDTVVEDPLAVAACVNQATNRG